MTSGARRRVDCSVRSSGLAGLALALALLVPATSRGEASDPGTAERSARQGVGSETPQRELLERANANLATPDRYPEAIALYREVLVSDPGHREARLWLARVLAWRGDYEEALAEFDELLRRAPGDVQLRVERAEVVSWSGAYGAALDAFGAVLREQPRNARAARGVARVHRWSGETWEALGAYERALALEDDAEAREEWEELRGPYVPRVELETSFFSDSSDFDRRDVWATVSGFQGQRTRVSARLGRIEVEHPQDDVPVSVRSRHDDDRALDLGLRVDHGLDSGPELTIEAGGRQWSAAADSVYLRAHAQHTFERLGSVGVHLVHEDFVDASSSFEAVQEGVQHTAVAGTLYRALTSRLAAFGRLEVGSIDDGNDRQALYASLGYRPFARRDLELTAAVSGSRYADDSDAYYAPERETGFGLAIDERLPLTSELRAEYQASLGFASTKERSLSESGTQWSALGKLVWERDHWTVSLHFGVSYSQRSSRYKTRRGALEVERRF